MPHVLVESPALPSTQRVHFTRQLVVGRGPQADLQILDGRVSKRHAVLHCLPDGGCSAEDLDSRNGTYVNGKLIAARTPLRPGDVVRIGESTLTLQTQEIPAGLIGDFSTTSLTLASHEISIDFPPARKVGSPEQLAADYDRLRLGWRLGREIGLHKPLTTQGKKVLEILLEEFDADRGVLFVAPDRDGEDLNADDLEPIAVATDEGNDGAEVSIPRTVLRGVLESRRGVLAADARMDQRFDQSKSVILQGIRSTLSVPLIARSGHVIGVLALDSTRVVNAFHEKDLLVLETVGQQIGTAIENLRLAKQMQKEAAARARLARLLSPNLVDEVVAGRLQISAAAEARNVTVMFTDLRGFTRMSQHVDPAEVLGVLNAHFGMSVEILFRHQGTLDKYMGDGLMALFGAPIGMKDAPRRAVTAAVEIQRAARVWNRKRVEEGAAPLQVGIGIASGAVVAGALGSPRTMSYTVIGPAVNLASRLCGVAGPGEVLLAESVYDAIGRPETATTGRRVDLKGFDDPVPAWCIKI